MGIEVYTLEYRCYTRHAGGALYCSHSVVILSSASVGLDPPPFMFKSETILNIELYILSIYQYKNVAMALRRYGHLTRLVEDIACT